MYNDMFVGVSTFTGTTVAERYEYLVDGNMKLIDENLEFKKIRKVRKYEIYGNTLASIGLLSSSIIFFINKNYILGYIFSIIFGLILIDIVYKIIYFNKNLQ